MKIIQIIPELGLGGAETMCETLSYKLKEFGCEVIVVSLYSTETIITKRIRSNGIRVVFLNKKTGIQPSMILDLLKIFKEEKPNAIHTHLYAAKYAVPAAILAGIKVRIHTIHSLADKECGKYDRFFNKILFSFCNTVPVALSDVIQNSILKVYSLSKEKVPVVFNGVDFSKCIPKNTYKIDKTFTIIHIGRFNQAKNHFGLVSAFSIFHKKYPKTKLWLLGDGELKKEIKDLVKEYDIEDAVVFLGKREDAFCFLNRADIFTLPSKYEGLPMTIIEAMGTGIPIVATKVGGIKDILNSSNSILTEVNEEEVADAFETYYLNYELRRKHGLKLLSERDLYSDKNMAIKYIDLYKSL